MVTWLQERELVGGERLRARELGGGVGGGEIDLVAVVVAELEHRRLDLEAVAALHEAAPVGAAAELAVGHDLEAGLLLQPHDVADGFVLDLGEGGASSSPCACWRKASRSSLGRSRLPT